MFRMEIVRLSVLTFVCLFGFASAQEPATVGAKDQKGRQYLRERPSNVTVVQGGDALLRCAVGYKQGEVRWVKDGLAMISERNSYPAYPRYRAVGDRIKGEYHLSITDAKLDDDDEFECQVSPALDDEHSSLRAGAYVVVLIPPNNVSIDGARLEPKIEAKAESPLDVTCRANGAKPAAQLRWYRNGRPVPDQFLETSHTAEDAKRFTTISRLRMKATAEYNGAIFTCEAIHPALQSSRPLQSQFTLSVIYPPGAPVITGHNPGRTLVAGDFVQLRCMVENANPPPDVIWYRGNVFVSRNSIYTQGYTKNDYSFHVQASDNDVDFRCEASNSASIGTSSSSIRMKVYFAPEKVEVMGPDRTRLKDTVQYTCKASASYPEAKLEWFINGEPYYDHSPRTLPAASGSGVESSSFIRFKITHRLPELTVMCKAINEHLSHARRREVVARKTTKVSYPPESVKVVVNGGKRFFVAGETVSLTCMAVGGNPMASVEWLRKDHKVTTGYTSRTDPSLNATISEYSFAVSQDDNQKEVQCRAHVPDIGSDWITDSVALHVQFPPDSLTISQSPIEFEAGKPSELSCESSSANPWPTVEWFRNDEKLESVVALNSTSDYGGRRVKKKLFLSPTVKDNGAVYECRAWSPIMAKPITNRVTLEVLYKPIFSVPTAQSYEVLKGEPVTLNASAYSNPAVEQYTWHKDTSTFTSLRSSPPRLLVNGSVIEIRQVEPRDAGTYTCKAKNRVGTSSMTVTIVVKYPANVTHITRALYVNVNDNVMLTCDIDAYPFPLNIARWERAGGDDMKEQRFVRNVTKGAAKLLINGVRREDTGNYTCFADNGIGKEDSKTTTIFVKQSPILDHSSVYAKAAAPLAKDGELTCVADGIPDVKFYWQRDSRMSSDTNHRVSPLLSENDRTSISSRKIGFIRYQSQVTIRNVQEKDYGVYRCVAENSLGSRSMDVTFGKPEAPEQPTGVRVLNKTHDTVTLDWLPGFSGGLQQRFVVKYRVGGNTFKSGHELLTTVLTTSATLTVDNLKAKTLYTFAIQAVNDLGSSGIADLTVDTLGPASVVQESAKEELPVLIIVLVCLVGIILLALNAALVVCFLRRHRRKKLEERAANARLGSSSGRKVQMYSSETGAVEAALYQREDKFGVDGDGQRPRSAMSEGNGSVRTVIEVDGGDAQTGYAIISGSPRLHAGYLLDSVNENFDDDVPSDFNYAETLRKNTLQRHLANGVYNVPEASIRQPNGPDRSKNTYVAGQAVDDILPPVASGPLPDTMSQEYGPYSYYQPPNGAQQNERKYSPTHSAQLHTNGRTPYAEVRPLLTISAAAPVDAIPNRGSPVRNPNRTRTGSPLLSTFAALPLRTTMQPEFDDDVDSLSGDLV